MQNRIDLSENNSARKSQQKCNNIILSVFNYDFYGVYIDVWIFKTNYYANE